MKNFCSFGSQIALLAIVMLSVLTVAKSLRLTHDISMSLKVKGSSRGNLNFMNIPKEGVNKQEELGMEMYPTGSSLPDCSHACGACFPCKRVMVSFRCQATESCPVVYRCMCNGKYYHVPSN